MFLRLILAMLSLAHSVSFAMIVHYKNKEAKKRVESSVRQCFARQEIAIEKERWQSLPQEEQAKYKLARLYKKQNNLKFVARYLKNQDVPIFLVSFDKDDTQIYGIDPYAKSFYKNPDKQIFAADPEIVEIGRLKTENIKKVHSRSYKGAIDSLGSGIVLGKDEDIVHEFVKVDEQLQGHNQVKYFMNIGCIDLAIKYPFVKNNALEILLQREKQLSAFWMGNNQRWDAGYLLLKMVTHDKKAFELVAHKDPYSSNRMLYTNLSGKQRTYLDRMKKKSDMFDQEHIDILVREGGMSVKEVEGMNQVDRILQGKMTLEEIVAENTWKQIIKNSNGENSNKYLESQILLRDTQERQAREETERRLMQRTMMMAGLMNAMLGDRDID